MNAPSRETTVRSALAAPTCPVRLSVERIAAFLNAELSDHPVYDGIEVQRFDDDTHGRGMLVFLSRRGSRLVDYYVEPGLRLDRATYHLGAGTGAWVVTEFDEGHLEVSSFGVHAEIRFTDVDGREIEVRIDDRLAGRRRPGTLLAPVGASIDEPTSLMLVHLHGFDLVRRVSPDPVIAIDGASAATGHLPGARLHRRHLIKYAAPLTTAVLCRATDGPIPPLPAGDVHLGDDERSVAVIAAQQGPSWAEVTFDPPLPGLEDLPVGQLVTGAWRIAVDGTTMTGGTWRALRRDDRVELGLDVSSPWVPPAGLPPLLRIVTRVIPTFRRWPTTYRWRAETVLGDEVVGTETAMTSRWERTETGLADRYRRATGG